MVGLLHGCGLSNTPPWLPQLVYGLGKAHPPPNYKRNHDEKKRWDVVRGYTALEVYRTTGGAMYPIFAPNGWGNVAAALNCAKERSAMMTKKESEGNGCEKMIHEIWWRKEQQVWRWWRASTIKRLCFSLLIPLSLPIWYHMTSYLVLSDCIIYDYMVIPYIHSDTWCKFIFIKSQNKMSSKW